jgi:ABC-type amino acid transport substrate-binding protein
VGFFAHFDPVSYSESEDPSAPGFNVHRGYEADLLTALETMPGPRLTLNRQGLALWEDIWLQPAGDRFDMVGGGITILDSRTRDAASREVVAFTSGHINFRQSLLVRKEDAESITTHDDLTADLKVGALTGTTGERRLLEILGLVNAEGALAEGVRVDVPGGTVVADGSMDYFITAAGAAPDLAGRSRLYLPGTDRPEVVQSGGEVGETELLSALAEGRIDAIARGEVGNLDAVYNSSETFAITALDDRVETGGFTVAATNTELAACLDERIDWLTDQQIIGYGEWLEDPRVFEKRATAWNNR